MNPPRIGRDPNSFFRILKNGLYYIARQAIFYFILSIECGSFQVKGIQAFGGADQDLIVRAVNTKNYFTGQAIASGIVKNLSIF